VVRRTPVVPWPGRDGLFLKLENLQRTGSFKLHGASLRLAALDDEERGRGVVAASAGNHGLGVALAGRALGITVEIVVPATSPAVKRAGIAALGATVLVGGPSYDDAEALARRRAAARGAVFISAFDDPLIIRGNGGLLGEEIAEQVPGLSQVVCPVGGGGLSGGLAAALCPRGVRIAGVQPEANCAMHDSLAQGRALTTYVGLPTLAEGCEGAVAESTYELCRGHGVTIALVSEAAIRRAMVQAYHLGLVVEPSSAVALAGVLEGAVPAASGTVVVVSGGNVEPDFLDEVLRA
jgi:threonine dehydratase